ncbi:unnamed protein product, partial [Soboliphyme baturini]|uniref:Intraflagellar transport protein 52-like protein n=1 Tax=Soboliphyme baturini TaxID=241478 RepID=A0A183J8E1_9BILA
CRNIPFLYPYGTTLTVSKPAVAILSTGTACYPICRPICALRHVSDSGGKLVVVGSTMLMHDQYFDKEENAAIVITDYSCIPNTLSLASRIKGSVQEGENDFTAHDLAKLPDRCLYNMTLSHFAALRAYEELKVKHEPLGLIPPKFFTPLPPLHISIYPAIFRCPPPPELELFDLDEVLSFEDVRMAQITNQCPQLCVISCRISFALDGEDDIDAYVSACADILGIHDRLPKDQQSAKHVLQFLLDQLVEFKKLNHVDDFTVS